MGLPTIDVVFKKLARTAVLRSARGVLAVVVQDATGSFDSRSYTELAAVEKTDYTAENYTAVSRAFEAAPYKVIVVRLSEEQTMADAAGILKKLVFNWVCAIPAALQGPLAEYVKEYNLKSKAHKIKAVVSGQAAADDMHIVNIPNTTVTPVRGSAEAIGGWLPYLGGVLAACPMTESVTGRELGLLSDVAPVEDIDASVDAGNMALYLDDGVVRISRGVNTLTTISGDYKTEEMKKIAIVEGIDLMNEDIVTTFKERYRGKFKNNADNQALFVSALQSYFGQLEREAVLNNGYDNSVSVDIAAQKAAWVSDGVDTLDWSDAYAKQRTYKSKVFLTAEVQLLDAMEDLKFVIYMA